MIRKTAVVVASAMAFFCGGVVMSMADVDKGPPEITMENPDSKAKKPKPAIFPHAKHQERIKCGECHHGKDDAGKQVAYKEGQKNEKCITCHTGDMLKDGPNKVKGKSALQRAGHGNCQKCHKQVAKEDEKKKKLKKCTTCHPKKKK